MSRLTDSRWLTRTQLMGFLLEAFGLKCNYYTISKLIRLGLPAHKHPASPGRPLFAVEEVRAWMGEQLARPMAPPPAVQSALRQGGRRGRPRKLPLPTAI